MRHAVVAKFFKQFRQLLVCHGTDFLCIRFRIELLTSRLFVSSCQFLHLLAHGLAHTADDKIFTRELWESATECPVVFPDGVGVVGWMVPGGREIAIKTAELMKKYDVVIWAHHGMFCSGEDFDLTFGLLHTVEKSAEILVKILSMTPNKLQTITPDNFRSLARDFKVSLPEEFLYEKQ